MFETFRTELDEHHDRRERIIKASRDITALSKKMIFSLQRVRQLQAPAPPAVATEVSAYGAKISDLFSSLAPDLRDLNAWRYRAQIASGVQEHVEAVSFRHYLETQRLMPFDEARAQMAGGVVLTGGGLRARAV
ncbi:hypothetical protein HO173_006976 [Letharia columbiana]|uniref:Uncharacterized protein n=1 Tax=Letharia columbiana TaxID=112416 RepID=A0A8H6FU08_9LECA|nr:uncharacterized protein HO173_006976 [Letharia columbiana]KAF6234756.1 hypothetical protein HO173_006976 [Letharia columbiana]